RRPRAAWPCPGEVRLRRIPAAAAQARQERVGGGLLAVERAVRGPGVLGALGTVGAAGATSAVSATSASAPSLLVVPGPFALGCGGPLPGAAFVLALLFEAPQPVLGVVRALDAGLTHVRLRPAADAASAATVRARPGHAAATRARAPRAGAESAPHPHDHDDD